jgi:hypothetical protein
MAIGSEIIQSGALKPSSLEQQEYESDLFAKRMTEIPSNMQARWVYDGDGNCIYAAYAPRGLAEDSVGWLIHKYTWSAGNCTKREIAYDSYSNYLTATYG